MTKHQKGNLLGSNPHIRRLHTISIPPCIHTIGSVTMAVMIVWLSLFFFFTLYSFLQLGGTIGDIEGMAFIEAFRQFQFKAKRENFCNIHVSLVPQVGKQLLLYWNNSKMMLLIHQKKSPHNTGNKRAIACIVTVERPLLFFFIFLAKLAHSPEI